MKVSEAIDQLKVGDTVWVRGKVSKKEKAGYPLQLEFAGFTKWIMPLEEISLTEPTPIDALAQEYDVEPETIREWLDKGHKGSFEKEPPRYQYPIKTMPALIADITYRKNLAKVALDKLDKEMYTTPIMRLAQQKYEIYSNVVNLLNDLEPVEQTERVEVTERQERLLKKYEDEPFHRLLNNCRTDEEDLLARARLNGYTVKSKRFKVCVDDRTLKHLQFCKNSKWVSFFENGTPMTFTDKSKAEAVALLVEGSVEEID